MNIRSVGYRFAARFTTLGVTAIIIGACSLVAFAEEKSKPSGDLAVVGEVTVNGTKAVSGTTVTSDSVISTSQNSSATISLGNLSRVELLPNTSIKLSFTDGSIIGVLSNGRARVEAPKGVTANISTKNGATIADGALASAFTVDCDCGKTVVSNHKGDVALKNESNFIKIAAGESSVVGQTTPNSRCTPQRREGVTPIHGHALLALLLIAVAAVGGAIATGVGDNENRTTGNTLSPFVGNNP